ncbi:MAG: exo-alpha-sialidase [Chloroflexi bacterium]|nr:exo-alpha-sialidase [Chloroflexota bacterium]
MTTNLRVVDRGLVYRGADHPEWARRSIRRTNVVRTTAGELIVSFRRCAGDDSPDGHPVVFASADEGRTWEERFSGRGQGALDGVPGQVMNLSIAEVEPGRLLGTSLWVDLSSGRPWVNPVTGGMLPLWIVHRESTDGGRTWGDARVLDLAPQIATTPCANPVMRLANGDLAQPFETLKAYDDADEAQSKAWLQVSHDGGRTWPTQVMVAGDPENARWYWDQRLAVRPDDGRLVGMFWTRDVAGQRDLPSSIAWGTPDGMSWTDPSSTGLPGQHTQPVPLGGERLLAVWSHRELPGIVASISEDFGRTWDRSRDLVLFRSDAGREPGAGQREDLAGYLQSMIRYHFGHPRAVRLPDGDIFATWCQGTDEVKDVAWARIRTGDPAPRPG